MSKSAFFPPLLRLGLILVVFNFFSCTTEDDAAPSVEENSSLPFNITVLATGSNSEIYQIDNIDKAENMDVINLTETMGVPGDFKNVYVYGTDVIFTNYQYTYWQKNVATGNSLTHTIECELGDSENRYLFIAPEVVSLLSMSHTGTNEGTLEFENYLNIYNPSIASCNRIYLNNGSMVDQQSVKILNGLIFLYQKDQETGVNSLMVKSIVTGEQVGNLEFDEEFRAILSDDRVYIKFGSGRYKEYDIEDLSFIKDGDKGNAPLPISRGVYTPTFDGTKMVFDFSYPQPSSLSTAPAIYDWSSNTMTYGGDYYLSDAFRSLQDEGFFNLSHQVVKVNVESNTLVVGYRDMQDPETGGIVFLNFEGAVLSHVELDYVPFEIMIRE